MIPAPLCSFCKHLIKDENGGPFACSAFPGGVPDAIFKSQHDHREPIKGDGGVLFSPKDKEGAEYADFLFGVTA